MTPLEPLEFPPPRPKLRFWHLLLGATGCLVLMLIAVGAFHWWRVRQQAKLVAEIEAVGGFVTHYHEVTRTPDGEFEHGPGPSLFSEEFRREYPNLCSQVIGIRGVRFESDGSSGLTPDQTERFFRAARGLPGLRWFSLESDFFSGSRISQLPSFRRLQDLEIHGEQVSDEDVLVIAQATDLRNLSLRGSQLTDAAIGPLAALPKLKSLSLHSPLITDAGLAQLRLPAQLESLSLNLPSVTDQGLCAVPKLRQLQGLELEMPVGDAAIAHLTAGGQLQWLLITQPRFGDAGLAAIAKNRQVGGRMTLSGSAVTDEGLRHLAALADIGVLELADTKITDAGLVHLSGVTTLGELVLSKTQVTGVGLVHLQGLSVLSNIDLSDCPLSQEGLKALAGLPALTELKLAGTPITDESCVLLPKWESSSTEASTDPSAKYASAPPSAQYAGLLDLSRTKLTDACVSRLMPTKFSQIHLDETGLTDVGLLTIAEDEGELAELSVKGTKVTAKGIVEFEEKLAARGHGVNLLHDIPETELEALRDARAATANAQAGAAASAGSPPP